MAFTVSTRSAGTSRTSVRVDGRQGGAALGHHAEVLEVLGGVGAAGDLVDDVVGRGGHVPGHAGHDVVRGQRRLVAHVADGDDVVLVGGLDDAEALRVEDVGAGVDLGQGGFLGRGRVEPAVDEADLGLHLGVDLASTRDEGVGDAVDLRNGHATHDADDARLGQAAGQHAGQVGWLMDPVVEDAKVRVGRPTAGAEDEGDVRIVGRHGAHGLLVAEGVTEDDVRHVELGDLAQGQLHVPGVAQVVREGVLDAAGVRLGLQRGVDDAVPGLLDLRGIGAEDLEGLVLGDDRSAAHGHGECQQPCGRAHGDTPDHR